MSANLGISEQERTAIAEGISHLLADTYTLYLKTHKFHWNVTGPMFQTLHLMFEISLQNNRIIDEGIYDSVGGVIGSLRTHADEIYNQLPDDAYRRSMRQIMLRMVSLEGMEYASRRALLSELSYPDAAENHRVQTIIELLCKERLIVKKSNEAEEDYVEPAHDALLWGWSTLWEWINDFGKEHILMRDRVAAAVSEWQREGKGAYGLWREERKLAELKDLLAERDLWPNKEEIAFAEACLEAHEHVRRKEEEIQREKQQLMLEKMEAEKQQLLFEKKAS